MTDDKTILITGASSGIGACASRRLLGMGYRVIGLGRRFDQDLVADTRFIKVELDLSGVRQLPAEFDRLSRKFPEISAILCCAGVGRFGALEQFSCAQIDELVHVNFLSHVYLLRAWLPLMKRRRQGRVILIGSEAALAGARYGAVYCATKFALRGLAQALREECAAAGISITMINPGMVRTGFFDTLDFKPGPAAENALTADDVVDAVCQVLAQPAHCVTDEINLSPLKKVVQRQGAPNTPESGR